jgi:hypothetical protein
MTIKHIKYSLLVLLVLGFILSCSLTRNQKTKYYDTYHDFRYFQTIDTILLKLVRFYKNDAYCYTEAIPYALLIGLPINNQNIPDTISILARCDNNIYRIGDTLTIIPIDNPEMSISLHKVSIVKDTLLQGKKTKWSIGSEYLGIWGKVLE